MVYKSELTDSKWFNDHISIITQPLYNRRSFLSLQINSNGHFATRQAID